MEGRIRPFALPTARLAHLHKKVAWRQFICVIRDPDPDARLTSSRNDSFAQCVLLCVCCCVYVVRSQKTPKQLPEQTQFNCLTDVETQPEVELRARSSSFLARTAGDCSREHLLRCEGGEDQCCV